MLQDLVVPPHENVHDVLPPIEPERLAAATGRQEYNRAEDQREHECDRVPEPDGGNSHNQVAHGEEGETGTIDERPHARGRALDPAGGQHRRCRSEREEGERTSWRIMAKIVAWLPREEKGKRDASRTIRLRTCADKFWAASVGGASEDEWVLNADHIRAWVTGHETARRRLSEDRKPEMPRRYVMRELRMKTSKHANRMKSFRQMSVSAFVKWAVRYGASMVVYNDSERGYVAPFPWEQLQTDLASKLDEAGIELEVTGKKEAEKATGDGAGEEETKTASGQG